MATKKTQKQKEFDMLIKYDGDKNEFTSKVDLSNIKFIRENQDKISWYVLSQRKLTNEIIEEFWDEIKRYLSYDKEFWNFKIDILKAIREVFHWYSFNFHNVNPLRFSLDFYKEFERELDPYIQSVSCDNRPITLLPEETLDYLVLEKKNERLINVLSSTTNISIHYIEKYKNLLDWKKLSTYSVELCKSKNFKKYEEYIDIASFASLKTITNDYYTSGSFILSKLNMVLTEDFLLKYKNAIDWKEIIYWESYRTNSKIENSKLKIVSSDFFKTHKDELPEEAIIEIENCIKNFGYDEETLHYGGLRYTLHYRWIF